MANGYTGKILRVNLTTKEISAIDTARYEEFGGGYAWQARTDVKDFDPTDDIP